MCALVQNLALMHPRVKRAFGVPITPLEQPHPYLHLRDQFNKRFSSRRKEQQEEEEKEEEMQSSQKEKEELKERVKSDVKKSERMGGSTKR